MKVFIIAEGGVNHNGSMDIAFQLVDLAVSAGADAIKFQTFKTENIVTKKAFKAEYQKKTTNTNESQYEMLKKLELSKDDYRELFDYCRRKGIVFLSSAFDFGSLDYLVRDLGVTTLKIPSGELTNGPFLLAHARTGCELILSTGMADLNEIKEALGVIAFVGVEKKLNSSIQPSKTAFRQAYSSVKGQKFLQEKVTLLHCTSEYPAPEEDINLNAMITMKEYFHVKIGYSDHSEGIIVPVAAATLGATIIEKHFTLDKTLPGPDHKASLEPEEFRAMVRSIRTVEKILGDGQKIPASSEKKNRAVGRKSIVASKNIMKGDFFTEDNLTFKRPGIGRSPMDYWEILGEKCSRNYQVDEVID